MMAVPVEFRLALMSTLVIFFSTVLNQHNISLDLFGQCWTSHCLLRLFTLVDRSLWYMYICRPVWSGAKPESAHRPTVPWLRTCSCNSNIHLICICVYVYNQTMHDKSHYNQTRLLKIISYCCSLRSAPLLYECWISALYMYSICCIK